MNLQSTPGNSNSLNTLKLESNRLLTPSNFHFHSDHFLYNLTLDNSNFSIFPMKVRITGSCLYWSKVESVGSLYSCMRNFEQWINMRGNYEISTSLVFLNLMKSNNILQTQRFFIQTEYREIIVKKLTVHYLFTHTGMQIWIWYCFLGQT